MDGRCTIRTSLPPAQLGDADLVRAYKSLARGERAFRWPKTTVLKVRPIFLWRERRVRAHLFVCWPTTRNGTCGGWNRCCSRSRAGRQGLPAR